MREYQVRICEEAQGDIPWAYSAIRHLPSSVCIRRRTPPLRRFELIETTSRYAYNGRIAAARLGLVVALHAVSPFGLGSVKCTIGKL
jgi:hypothetical protein